MKFIKRFVLAGVALMIIATLFVFGNINPSKNSSNNLDQAKKDELASLAKQKFEEEKSKGTNFSNGPCLGIVAIGWVVDIAHNPRQKAIDDKPENQCSDYLSGSVSHFIELDTKGNLIKIQ